MTCESKLVEFFIHGLLGGSVAGSLYGLVQSMADKTPLVDGVISNGVTAGIFGGLCFMVYAFFKYCM